MSYVTGLVADAVFRVLRRRTNEMVSRRSDKIKNALAFTRHVAARLVSKKRDGRTAAGYGKPTNASS
jgi:hypothetical protein